MKKKDRLRARELDQGRNIKVAESATTPAIDYPIFCFKHLRKGFSIDDCTEEEKAALINQLAKLSSLTWDQIKLAPRHGMGMEKIATDSIVPDLPNFLSADVDHLLAFRFSGLKPFLGHRRGPILHILFIDNKFNVYNHGT